MKQLKSSDLQILLIGDFRLFAYQGQPQVISSNTKYLKLQPNLKFHAIGKHQVPSINEMWLKEVSLHIFHKDFFALQMLEKFCKPHYSLGGCLMKCLPRKVW